MERWAFATSLPPFGLGMSSAEFWFLSLDEYDAKVDRWELWRKDQIFMFTSLRADLHNGQLTRQDKQLWKAQDFGADEPKQKKPQGVNRDQLKTRLLMKFGPGKNGSVLKTLKGQVLPAEVAAKIAKGA